MTSLHQLPTSALRGQVPLPKIDADEEEIGDAVAIYNVRTGRLVRAYHLPVIEHPFRARGEERPPAKYVTADIEGRRGVVIYAGNTRTLHALED